MGPETIAHRGGLWDDAAENTIEGFRRCAELGLDWIETDVHASSDGVLFAVHDPDLGRLADRPERLSHLTAAELDRIELRGGGRLPRLSAVVEELPAVSFNIDVKADRSVAATVRLVRRMDLGPRIRLASFSAARLTRLRTALPGVRTSAGTAETARFLALGARAARAFDPGLDALQVPYRRGPLRVVTRRFVREAHRAGLVVHVWTVNDAARMRALADLGVDGIVTDRPARALAVLADHRSPGMSTPSGESIPSGE